MEEKKKKRKRTKEEDGEHEIESLKLDLLTHRNLVS